MQPAEFDKFADSYLHLHAANVGISGEDPDFFARYKIVELRRLWTRKSLPEPATILDFGCGIGASLPYLAAAFPTARLSAFDISERSLAIARHRFAGLADFIQGDEEIKLDAGKFDLIFSSCVFHHIDTLHHVDLFRQLHAALSVTGRLVVFEHNPLNPATRYIVATCPFDENAILLSAAQLRGRQRKAGFHAIETRYVGFFPHALKWLRWIEPGLSALPLGAQYYTMAHA